MTKTKLEVLDTKEKVFNELRIKSEQELSNENVFRRLIQLGDRVDREILDMILPKIDNFAGLVEKQQQFISGMADKQKQLDEKTIDSFNKTKDIISEILKANPSLDTNMMVYLVDSLKEMDRLILDHTKEAGKRIDRLIQAGIAIGGLVATAIFAVIFKGGGGDGEA